MTSKKLSILVISRSFINMNQFLESLDRAITTSKNNMEILCSWNGSDEDVKKIIVPRQLNLIIHKISPYNFSKNNNELARLSSGDFVAFLNDDLVLDNKSIDYALEDIADEVIGIVGASLRYADERIQHAGVFFDEVGKPFHRHKGSKHYLDQDLIVSKFVPALTGAFLLMRRYEFMQILFDESFQVAGEDIVLCLEYRKKFPRKLLYSSKVTAIHLENVTRKTTGQRLTPLEDLEKIKKTFFSMPKETKIKVRIVTEEQGWIMYRKAEEIAKNNSTLDVRINEDFPDADIHYYINYGKFGKRPANGIVIANFTHYDKDGLGDKFFTVANLVDYCTAVSLSTATDLEKFGIAKEKISVILVGADKSFVPKLLVGLVGRIYKGGRKGECLVEDIISDKEIMNSVELVAAYDGWNIPIMKTDSLHTFYRAIDYLLVPSLIEGGPVPVMEALAVGTLSIAPKIGVIPQFPHVSYECGDFNSLKKILLKLSKEYILSRTFLTNEIRRINWESWGFEHERLFQQLMYSKMKQG